MKICGRSGTEFVGIQNYDGQRHHCCLMDNHCYLTVESPDVSLTILR